MSANCLFTKLKEVVNNPNLPLYNAIVIDVHEVANPTQNSQWLKVEGDGVTVEIPEEYPMTDSTHLANGTYKVIIRKKYNLSGQFCLGNSSTINIEQLEYCSGITSLVGASVKVGDIKSLASLINCDKFQLSGSPELYGDISVFENMNSLNTVGISNSVLHGNIGVFGNFPEMTQLSIYNSAGLNGNIEDLGSLINIHIPLLTGTNVHGSFDEYVTRQVAAGRVTYREENSCGGLLSTCNFGGKTRTSGNIWTYPSWDGANKVIVYVGANGYENCPYIYEKGATAEEIAAWQAAGKTVTDVLTDTVYPPTNG